MQFSPADEGQYFNFDSHDVNCADVTMNDKCILYYDWLADSVTTLHICNARKAFIDYESIDTILVIGVGNIKAHAKGRGSVKIKSHCDEHEYTLQLENVLHVPGNNNNLISLGQWDCDGHQYEGLNSILMLFTKDGISVACGTKIANNLYKMNFRICKDQISMEHTYASAKPETWETWHWRFRHIRYSGLQRMLDEKLVKGFEVNITSPKPNCTTYTEVKQSVKPFSASVTHQTDLRQLTHTNVWGKYEIVSINHNQYFILMIDDATHHISVAFLKTKDQAAQAVKNYLTYL